MLAALAVLASQNLDVAEWLFAIAALVFFVAFILITFNKQWPKASTKAPLFVALALTVLAIGLLFFA